MTWMYANRPKIATNTSPIAIQMDLKRMASSSMLPWREAPLRRFDALILGAVTLSTGTLVGRPDMTLATLVVIDFLLRVFTRLPHQCWVSGLIAGVFDSLLLASLVNTVTLLS